MSHNFKLGPGIFVQIKITISVLIQSCSSLKQTKEVKFSLTTHKATSGINNFKNVSQENLKRKFVTENIFLQFKIVRDQLNIHTVKHIKHKILKNKLHVYKSSIISFCLIIYHSEIQELKTLSSNLSLNNLNYKTKHYQYKQAYIN